MKRLHSEVVNETATQWSRQWNGYAVKPSMKRLRSEVVNETATQWSRQWNGYAVKPSMKWLRSEAVNETATHALQLRDKERNCVRSNERR